MTSGIKIEYHDKQYILRFTRKTAMALENAGFSVDLLGSKPVTLLPLLIRSAFAANHPSVRADEAEEIFKALPNKSDLISELISLYSSTISTLFDEVEDAGESEGNVVWGRF